MIFVARVEVKKTSYMQEGSDSSFKMHTVEADNDEQACEKIEKFYDDKSDDYGDSYRAWDIELSEHIE